MSKDYPKRYKAMLDYFGKDNHFVAEITGRKYSAVKDATYSKTKAFSMWAKLAVWVFEEMKEPWIMCCDDMPEMGQEVLYCTPSGVKGDTELVVCSGEYGHDNEKGFVDHSAWSDIYGYEIDTNVVCWMPQVKPFKPKDNE